MIVLVINNGSTSSRFSLINPETDEVLAHGGSERINTPFSYFKYENNNGNKIRENVEISNCSLAIDIMYKHILDNNYGVINSIKDIDVIGHRVVHGEEKYTVATFINDDVLQNIKDFSFMAPIHNIKSAETIEICMEKFKNLSNIAVFDTAFHSTIPKENFLYAIPQELYEKHKIRKYGFHGISYNYVLKEYCKFVNSKIEDTNIIACHLGGGSSICSIKNGKSFDTTMGYTPLTGLIMASRSGNIDPAVLIKIMEIYKFTPEEAIKFLNEKGGYLAICGEKDAESIVERSKANDMKAIFLRRMIDVDFKKNLLGMMSNMEKIDSIVLTGGIGSKNIEQREMLLSNLEQFGIKIDKQKNQKLFNSNGRINSKDSNIPIFIIPDDEEKEIASQCLKLVKGT